MTLSRQNEFRLGDVTVLPRMDTLVAGRKRWGVQPGSMRILLKLAERAPDFVSEADLVEAAGYDGHDHSRELAAALDQLKQALDELIESSPDRRHRLTVEPDTTGTRLFETESGTISARPASCA